ncbi:MAG TPA: carboxypeptidase regulatory-like domain-containing protein [Spirochaetia bacterium]|nr:carboxypeptidase regulatory-like domain-containing protein [Spirochaetia bacterium]
MKLGTERLGSIARCGLVVAALAVIGGCPVPGGTGVTGAIEGHARYTSLADDSGILVSADGVDGSGKTVLVRGLLRGARGASRAVTAQATTGSDGSYSLSDLAPGTYTIYASSQSSLEKAVTTSVTVEAGRTVTAVDLNLTPTGSISGTVTLNGALSGNLGIVVFVAGTSYSAMTADSGGFTISGVPASTGYTIVASMAGYDSWINDADVVAGQTTPVGQVALSPHATPAATGSVTGAAKLNGVSSGNSGIFVFLDGTGYMTMCADNGTFAIPNVPPGTYSVVASRTGYSSASVGSIVVSAGSAAAAGTMNLTSPGGSVTGTARRGGASSGNTGITVSLIGTSSMTVTGDDGSFTISGVAPGTYTLLAAMQGYTSSYVGSIVVSAGGTASAGTIDLAPLGYTVTTVAGSNLTWGSTDGTRSAARFYTPMGVATDGVNLYIADDTNHSIRKIVVSSGIVTTFAGSAAVAGSTDATGTAARFSNPMGIASDGTNLYVADTGNSTIRKIVISTGAVTTLAGSALLSGSADGTGAAARFNQPMGITTDGTNLYVADTYNNTLRKVVISSGAVTTIAGSAGSPGSADGVGSAARFSWPEGLATDGTNLYVADYNNATIRQVVIATGSVTTLAGSAGIHNHVDAAGGAARFSAVRGVTTDGTSLFVTDGQTVRKIELATGAVTTIAGLYGTNGYQDGVGVAARFNAACGIVWGGPSLFLTDMNAYLVRMLSP